MKFKAITLQSTNGGFIEIITKVGVSSQIGNKNAAEDIQTTFWTSCLWDTGASHSAITKETVNALGILPEGEARIIYGNGETITKFYIVSLVLPNLLFLPVLRVTEAAANDGFGVILGMDVISQGDFAITNVNGVSTFSFCVPGIETIDYVERIKMQDVGSGLNLDL
jgi:hypothetical protein